MAVAGCVYALFHGYFDHGHFELKQSQRSPPNRVAMLAERWDEQSLGGLQDFVVIGDHTYSPAELRHALYSDAVIFSALSDCIKLRWDGPKKLIIRCEGSTIDTRHINRQKHQVGDISVSYENIASK